MIFQARNTDDVDPAAADDACFMFARFRRYKLLAKLMLMMFACCGQTGSADNALGQLMLTMLADFLQACDANITLAQLMLMMLDGRFPDPQHNTLAQLMLMMLA